MFFDPLVGHDPGHNWILFVLVSVVSLAVVLGVNAYQRSLAKTRLAELDDERRYWETIGQ